VQLGAFLKLFLIKHILGLHTGRPVPQDYLPNGLSLGLMHREVHLGRGGATIRAGGEVMQPPPFSNFNVFTVLIPHLPMHCPHL